jgi:hypothetical protein
MADPLLTYIRPNFPVETETESGFTTEIHYVGPSATLAAGKPSVTDSYGGYTGTVVYSQLEPLGRTGYSELIIRCFQSYEAGSTVGTVAEVSYEIDWVAIERSLYEHKEFSSGSFSLTSGDKIDIACWLKETDVDAKKLFSYWLRDKDGNPTGSAVYLLDVNAIYFCEYILAGVEVWTDYAPVARRTRTYTGGPPSDSDAGSKTNPTGFPNLPSGYEWLKTADRSLKAGGQARWTRSDEYTGAVKVLVDKDTLYL